MWKKELKQPDGSPPFFVLKKTFDQGRGYDRTQVKVIVSLGDGFEHRSGYRKYTVEAKNPDRPWESGIMTKGIHVQVSMNGTAQLTYDDFYELESEIRKAWHFLEKL